MPSPLIILHGWSDEAASFRRLAGHLAEVVPGLEVEEIVLGEYLSMDDTVRFSDLVAAMERAWGERGLPRKPQSVDLLAHSTGALVARDWMATCFPDGRTPVHHLVLLAPAHFGSPLAHLGRSLLGRVSRGFFRRGEDQRVFHTGGQILRGLELGSPYTWELAQRDRFGEEESTAYGPGRTLATVLIGDRGYPGIRGIRNEPGSDGTVRWSGADLNPVYTRLEYRCEGDPATEPERPCLAEVRESAGPTAFRLLPGVDHGTITLNRAPSRLTKAQQGVREVIVRALTVTEEDFAVYCEECAAATSALAGEDGHQNTVVRVRDQAGDPVEDYLLEFYDPARPDGGAAAERLHREGVEHLHVNRANPSYRCFYLSTRVFRREARRLPGPLALSLTAEPDLEENPVGYRTLSDDEIDDFLLDESTLARLLQPHRTLLLEIVLKRRQRRGVMVLR